jgi:hypothetical protein
VGFSGGAGGVAFTPNLPPDRCDDPNETTSAAAITAQLNAASTWTPEAIRAAYPIAFENDLGYEPRNAAGLEIIQASGLGMNADELAVFDQNGFVLSDRQRFPTFFYGYRSIYSEDLPLYITVDSILHAVHRSYDDILASIEWDILQPALANLLDGIRAAAQTATDVPAEALADVDFFVAVAKSLLEGTVSAPVAGADATRIANFFDQAMQADGIATVQLFGVDRDVDFSQFEPRGHYTDGLQNYFRAMMWLGRIDLRLLESQANGTQVLRRRQVAAALALAELMDESLDSTWSGIDGVIGRFVGEVDSMTPPQADALRTQLGLASLADLDTLSDQGLGQAILDSDYGMQRIASHLMVIAADDTVPLSRSFTVLGQRYVLDSHVFSNVVYDRVQARRMMPSPLDVAFAALGNDQALELLAPELETYHYAGQLGAMRLLADDHGCGFFESNLYTAWLGALRALSPTSDAADPSGVGLPSIAGTDAWGRRMLSTQLASWAELRHDTLLYAKQSYTGIPVCEFPDAYVDPYPEAFDRIAALAGQGRDMAAALPRRSIGSGQTVDRIDAYFSHLYDVALLLREMAEHERSGSALTDEHLAFINDAVVYKSENVGCASIDAPAGWYPRLFFDPMSSDREDPTIADVHTQPADEGGNIVGRILHVATGMPRLFVTTIETCTGPRAYAGVASSYLEKVTTDFDRMTDERWAEEIQSVTPPDTPWLAPLVAR